MSKSKKNLRFIRLMLFSIITLIVLGSLSFHLSEGWSYLDSLYFTIITFATIGYGDITPITNIGKILAMFYAILGVPLFIGALSIIIESRMKNFIIYHFGNHVRKIEKEEFQIENKLEKEEFQIESIKKEMKKIEKKIGQKKENILTRILNKLRK